MKKNQRRKKPSKTTRMQVLEVVGLSQVPLGPTQIQDIWFEKYSRYRKLILKRRNKQHTHIFKILKELANEPKFLKTKISYIKFAQKQIDTIRNQYGIKDDPPNTITGILVTNPTPEQNKRLDAEVTISRIKGDKKNQKYKYILNFRGFLRYLSWVNNFGKINPKRIDTIRQNLLVSDPALTFLEYFEAFDIKTRVDLLIEISGGLEYGLEKMTEEYHEYEAMFHLYNEILFWDSFNNRNPFRRILSKKQKEEMLILKGYKLKILHRLAPLQLDWAERLRADMEETERQIRNFFTY